MSYDTNAKSDEAHVQGVADQEESERFPDGLSNKEQQMCVCFTFVSVVFNCIIFNLPFSFQN